MSEPKEKALRGKPLADHLLSIADLVEGDVNDIDGRMRRLRESIIVDAETMAKIEAAPLGEIVFVGDNFPGIVITSEDRGLTTDPLGEVIEVLKMENGGSLNFFRTGIEFQSGIVLAPRVECKG